MFKVTFEDDGQGVLDAIIALFGSTGREYVLTRAAKVAAVTAESVVSEYPPQTGDPLPVVYSRVSEAQKPYRPAPGQPLRQPGTTFASKFKSMRQQGKVMSLVNEGAIPYKRTGTLGKSLNSSGVVEDVNDTVATVSVGSNVPYAPYVKGEEEQANYHAGNWLTLADDLSAGLDTITEKIQNELNRAAIDFINGNR